jgi:hypothetical protein
MQQRVRSSLGLLVPVLALVVLNSTSVRMMPRQQDCLDPNQNFAHQL